MGARVWTRLAASPASVAPDTPGTGVRGTSTSVCQTPAPPTGPRTVSSSSTTISATANPDTEAVIVTSRRLSVRRIPATMEANVMSRVTDQDTTANVPKAILVLDVTSAEITRVL